jgi:hypothetical protein
MLTFLLPKKIMWPGFTVIKNFLDYLCIILTQAGLTEIKLLSTIFLLNTKVSNQNLAFIGYDILIGCFWAWVQISSSKFLRITLRKTTDILHVNWQALSHKVISNTSHIGRKPNSWYFRHRLCCKSKHHAIATTAVVFLRVILYSVVH